MVIASALLLLHLAAGIQAVPRAAIAATDGTVSTVSARPAQPLPVAPAPNTQEPGDAAYAALSPDTGGSSGQNSQALDTVHVSQLPPSTYAGVIGVENLPSRKKWLLLMIADHSAAAFDAYSTRSAISRGAVESDPLIRPFAGSDGLYAAIQVAPVALDFIARRMQRSQNSLLRRTWWLPQSASTGLFLFAGAHNLIVAGR